MVKVVQMDGTMSPAARIPSDFAIEEVEALLERVRSGDVQGVVFAAVHHDGACSWRIAGRVGSFSLIGAMQVALADLIDFSRGA